MKRISIIIQLLLIITHVFAKQNIVELKAPEGIQTYSSIITNLSVEVNTSKPIVSYTWNFYGNGTVITTTKAKSTTFKFTRTGNFYLIVMAKTTDGATGSATIYVKVLSGNGSQSYINAPVAYTPSKLKAYKPGDGVETKYAVILQGADESDGLYTSFSSQCTKLYNKLTNNYGYFAQNVYYLSGSIPNPQQPVDSPATTSAIVNAFKALQNKMDGDDILFIWMDDHGYGYDKAEYCLPASADELTRGSAYWARKFWDMAGGLGTSINETGTDTKESDFLFNPWSVKYPDGTTRRFPGLNKWILINPDTMSFS